MAGVKLKLTPDGRDGCVGIDIRGGGCWVNPMLGGGTFTAPDIVVNGDGTPPLGSALLNRLLPRPFGFMLSPIICLIRKTAPGIQ